jgi:hypothetical protein
MESVTRDESASQTRLSHHPQVIPRAISTPTAGLVKLWIALRWGLYSSLAEQW